jgi:hypothetical protein
LNRSSGAAGFVKFDYRAASNLEQIWQYVSRHNGPELALHGSLSLVIRHGRYDRSVAVDLRRRRRRRHRHRRRSRCSSCCCQQCCSIDKLFRHGRRRFRELGGERRRSITRRQARDALRPMSEVWAKNWPVGRPSLRSW